MGNSGSPVVALGDSFFREVLPRIRDLEELKAFLYAAWVSASRGTEGAPVRELMTPEIIRFVLNPSSPRPAEIRFREVLDRAIANGSVVRASVSPTTHDDYIFPVLDEARHPASRLESQPADSGSALGLPASDTVKVYRPNVFALYERHIGPLSPLVAEQIQQAEKAYPAVWLEQAIVEAVAYNRRNWRYIETVLAEWERGGGPYASGSGD